MSSTPTKQTRLLVVDDEEDLRHLIAIDLAKKGHLVHEASNVDNAIGVLEKEPIDLVLSDMRMPQKSGLDLLNWVRARNRETPVFIIISGFSDCPVENALSLGANAFFNKPFNRRQFSQELSRHLSHVHGEQWKLHPDPYPTENIVLTPSNVKLGHGGFSTPAPSSLALGTVVAFTIGSWRGVAQLRWSKPMGSGYEFIYLTDKTREEILGELSRTKPLAYIPLP